MNRILREIMEWLICIILAVIVLFCIRYYIGTSTIVKQTSMFQTLLPDERLWLNRLSRTMKKMPERGDIVTFEAPSVTRVHKENYTNPVAIYNNEQQGLLEKFSYYVLENGKISYIKRVIGLPGEYIEIKNGNVYIDGKRLEEDYLQDGVITDMIQGNRDEAFFTDFTVPENCVFVMGDNRTGSIDSRSFGCIPLEKIEGTVEFRFWPFSKFGIVK